MTNEEPLPFGDKPFDLGVYLFIYLEGVCARARAHVVFRFPSLVFLSEAYKLKLNFKRINLPLKKKQRKEISALNSISFKQTPRFISVKTDPKPEKNKGERGKREGKKKKKTTQAAG